MIYDILDDPRYDTTPICRSVVVSRNPTYTGFSRKKLLRLLGLPSTSTWEDANPKIKERIVNAIRAGDETAASEWSVIRDELEKRLAHFCQTCGTVIRSKSRQCLSCNVQEVGRHQRKDGWWRDRPDFLNMLGKRSDAGVANVFGMHRASISSIRKRLGIRAYDCFVNDVSPDRSARRRQWPEGVIAKLGTVPDSEIEKVFGYPRYLVVAERKIRKIPPFQPQRKAPHLKKKYRELMGTMTDSELSRISGVPRESITYRRNRAGIQAFQRAAQ
jgi:hypothetical protein